MIKIHLINKKIMLNLVWTVPSSILVGTINMNYQYNSVSQGKLKLNGHSSTKEYKLLDPASSLQDIHIVHRGGAQTPIVHLVQ